MTEPRKIGVSVIGPHVHLPRKRLEDDEPLATKRKPMDADRIRKTLEPYLSELDIDDEDPGGYTVKFHEDLQDEKTHLHWYEINDFITHKLGGTWIHEPRVMKAHWLIPQG